jgi:hypothetical protein
LRRTFSLIKDIIIRCTIKVAYRSFIETGFT